MNVPGRFSGQFIVWCDAVVFRHKPPLHTKVTTLHCEIDTSHIIILCRGLNFNTSPLMHVKSRYFNIKWRISSGAEVSVLIDRWIYTWLAYLCNTLKPSSLSFNLHFIVDINFSIILKMAVYNVLELQVVWPENMCCLSCATRCGLRVSICFSPLLATFYCFYQVWELRAGTTQLILSGQKLDTTHIYNSGNSQALREWPRSGEWGHVWPTQSLSSTSQEVLWIYLLMCLLWCQVSWFGTTLYFKSKILSTQSRIYQKA